MKQFFIVLLTATAFAFPLKAENVDGTDLPHRCSNVELTNFVDENQIYGFFVEGDFDQSGQTDLALINAKDGWLGLEVYLNGSQTTCAPDIWLKGTDIPWEYTGPRWSWTVRADSDNNLNLYSTFFAGVGAIDRTWLGNLTINIRDDKNFELIGWDVHESRYFLEDICKVEIEFTEPLEIPTRDCICPPFNLYEHLVEMSAREVAPLMLTQSQTLPEQLGIFLEQYLPERLNSRQTPTPGSYILSSNDDRYFNLVALADLFLDYWRNTSALADETSLEPATSLEIAWIKLLYFYQSLIRDYGGGRFVGLHSPSPNCYDDVIRYKRFTDTILRHPEQQRTVFQSLVTVYSSNEAILRPLILSTLRSEQTRSQAVETIEAFINVHENWSELEIEPYPSTGAFVRANFLSASTIWQGFDLEGFWRRRRLDGTSSFVYETLIDWREALE